MESNDLIGYVIVGAVVIVLICFQLKYFFNPDAFIISIRFFLLAYNCVRFVS